MPKTHRIGILTFKSCSQSAVHGIEEMCEVANEQARLLGISDQIAAARVSAGSEAEFHVSNQLCFSAIVCPPITGSVDIEMPRAVIRWLVESADAGTTMCSACGGAFVLAQAGLLDHRRATTHWSLTEVFEARYPAIDVRTEDILIEDPDIITAGGVMAWTQLGLRLIARFLGHDVMLATAKFMLIDPADRPQRYYAPFAPRLDHGDLGIADVQRWLHTSLGRGITLDQMAARARTSKRTLLRRFNRATGMNPTDYCQRLRVSHSRSLLERSDISIDEIAVQCGYEDQNSYRKIFKRVVGITPGEYRTRLAVVTSHYALAQDRKATY